MNQRELENLLLKLQEKKITVDEVLHALKTGPLKIDNLDFLTADHHRSLRTGFGEVIYSESKSVEQLVSIAAVFSKKKEPVLFTRLKKKQYKELQKAYPDGRGNLTGRTYILNPLAQSPDANDEPYVSLVCAGTSDIPVLEEAAETCAALGVHSKKITDVGVAGLHRIIGKLDILQKSSSVVVIAGMEGALPSVVGGLVDCPVFAVPTSVGYGASFKGVSALLGMLNSCAPGVAVLNINNGFSAAFAACQVIKMIKKSHP
jgi:hypothetical protein